MTTTDYTAVLFTEQFCTLFYVYMRAYGGAANSRVTVKCQSVE